MSRLGMPRTWFADNSHSSPKYCLAKAGWERWDRPPADTGAADANDTVTRTHATLLAHVAVLPEHLEQGEELNPSKAEAQTIDRNDAACPA